MAASSVGANSGIAYMLRDLLFEIGLEKASALFISKITIFIGIVIISYLANLVAKRFLMPKLKIFIGHTTTKWDDIFLDNKTFEQLIHIIPALVFYLFAYSIPGWTDWIHRVALTYMILIGVLTINALLNSGVDIYRHFEISKEKPIKGYVQILKIVIYVIGTILMISTLMKRSPTGLLTGLGAMTAILILVFKDTILSLVASFQIASNDMVHRDDWISFPKYGADGDVIDMTLHTVKIQNWDKTISTIPTYAFINYSFQNWRGMQESGGRRIKRAINLNMNSVRFCTEEMLRRYEEIYYLKDYIKKKKKEIANHNEEHRIGLQDISGRRMTNIGTFRAYLANYLRNHPMINQNMSFLIRHLQPTEHGLPIEIYVFSSDKAWANYEAIQADIFDHILAVLPEFGLQVFQNPTGHDFNSLLTR